MSSQQSLKKTGFAPWLSLMALNIRNHFAQWTFFLPSWILSLLKTLLSAAVFFYMGEFVGKGAASHIAEYGMSFGPYIVLGLIFNRVLSTTLDSLYNTYLFGYWTSQFDTYLAHPGGVSAFFSGELIAQYLTLGINTSIYMVVGVAFFRVPFVVAQLPSVFVILLLGILAILGLGFIAASSFTLLNSKRWDSNPITWIVNFAVTLLAGVYFPPSVLPKWLQAMAEWLPHKHVLHSARLCLSGLAHLSDPRVVSDIVFLLKFTAVSLPIGVALFALGMRKAEKEGTLSRWS
jgi:ABC-2 type transport system permease protein